MDQTFSGTSEEEYNEVLTYLFDTLPMFQRVGDAAFRKDLTNTIKLCDYLGNPERKFKSIHVAGTNGKGSSCHYLASILQKAGYKTGLYTSPHLKSFTERIRLNGQEVSKKFVVDFVRNNRTFIEELKPSFFEITVGMAFDYFVRENVDIAIIEVGMGGRLDSTNVILPEISLITNISLDHQQWLGDTLQKIAGEKAGIIKPGVPVVLSENQPELLETFKNAAENRHSPIYYAYRNFTILTDNQEWIFKKEGKVVFRLSGEGIPTYQKSNLPGVWQTIDLLVEKGWSVTNTNITDGIIDMVSTTGLKGRWQELADHPAIYCDVGHNIAGIQYMLRQIERTDFKKIHFIWGMVKDKDIRPVLKLLPKDARYYFCEASIPRAMPADELYTLALECGLEGMVVRDVNKALQKARKMAGHDDLIIIGGSNFVVAELSEL